MNKRTSGTKKNNNTKKCNFIEEKFYDGMSFEDDTLACTKKVTRALSKY